MEWGFPSQFGLFECFHKKIFAVIQDHHPRYLNRKGCKVVSPSQTRQHSFGFFSSFLDICWLLWLSEVYVVKNWRII